MMDPVRGISSLGYASQCYLADPDPRLAAKFLRAWNISPMIGVEHDHFVECEVAMVGQE